MEKSKKRLQTFDNLCLMDDELFFNVFNNNVKATQLIIDIIISKRKLKVISSNVKEYNKSFNGQDKMILVSAIDEKDKTIFIGIKCLRKNANPKTASLSASILDSWIINDATDVSELNECYAILFTEKDILGKGFAIYNIERQIKEASESFDDGSHIVFVNTEYKEADEIGKLIHDFYCKNPLEMNYKILADSVQILKGFPLKRYKGSEIKKIRSKTGLSLILFAEFLGVSPNTVKAWETGGKLPGGAACRLLSILERIPSFPEEAGIIKVFEKRVEKLPESGHRNESGDYALPSAENCDEDEIYDEIYGRNSK